LLAPPPPPPLGPLQRRQHLGEVVVVDDGEAAGGSGQGHVQVLAALGGLGEDAGRVDDDDGVELQALGLLGGQDDHGGVQRVRGGARGRVREGAQDGGVAGGGGDDGEAALLVRAADVVVVSAGDE